MTEHLDSDGLDASDVEYYESDDTSANGCATCGAAIVDTYYEVNGRLICPTCQQNMAQSLQGGSRFIRFVSASFLGLVAAVIGAGIYFAVAALTGYEIGLVAIVVGLLVGGGVRIGARARGGWFYQTLAIVLTYFSIVATYVPTLFKASADQAMSDVANETRQIARIIVHHDDSISLDGNTVTLEDLKPPLEHLASVGGIVWYHREGIRDAGPSDAANAVGNTIEGVGLPYVVFVDDHFERPESTWAMATRGGPLAQAFILVLAFIFALAVPFLSLPASYMGLIIIGIALYSAWKINLRQHISIAGPYQLT
ncbi:MAG: hypothetical protein JXO22_03245, partial [Phycisphaerae bacterium]|nr:hypothetical protein [Phycisphaerae bacterium]